MITAQFKEFSEFCYKKMSKKGKIKKVLRIFFIRKYVIKHYKKKLGFNIKKCSYSLIFCGDSKARILRFYR